MDSDRWDQIKTNIKGKFEVIDERIEDLIVDGPEGEEKQGTQEVLIVESPLGQIKLVWESRPKVLEKKMTFTHRQGQSAQTEYVTSDKELSHKLRIFKASDLDEWQELDEKSLASLG